MRVKKEKSSSIPVAVLGLIGAALTACGGLTGALISGAATLYRLEREMQQVAIPAPGSGQTLSVDGTDIFITRRQAAALDPQIYFVDLDLGLAMRRPLPGWEDMERLTVDEQMAESSTVPAVPQLGQLPVLRIRRGDPVEIRFDRQTQINGQPLTEERIEFLEQLYGLEPWTLPYDSQVTVNVFDRSTVAQLGITDLPDLLLTVTGVLEGSVDRLTAAEGSGFLIVLSSTDYDGVVVGEETGRLSVESWLLLAESAEAFYTVEIAYAPQSGQSIQVWEDLQTYMDFFRLVK